MINPIKTVIIGHKKYSIKIIPSDCGFIVLTSNLTTNAKGMA